MTHLEGINGDKAGICEELLLSTLLIVTFAYTSKQYSSIMSMPRLVPHYSRSSLTRIRWGTDLMPLDQSCWLSLGSSEGCARGQGGVGVGVVRWVERRKDGRGTRRRTHRKAPLQICTNVTRGSGRGKPGGVIKVVGVVRGIKTWGRTCTHGSGAPSRA